MVVIRLARFGAKKRPKYRITVADSRRWTKGRYLEVIGNFNPDPRGQEEEIRLDMDKAKAWIQKGAQPSQTVKDIMRRFEGVKA